jgi:DNA-binding response OmpR family regulator
MPVQSRILIVQADEAERLFQRALFSNAGMSAREAASGSEALELLAQEGPDLIVLGRSLPDLDGLELLPRLKSGELDFTPVLVVSHKNDTMERVRGLQLGADDYLGRPCDPPSCWRGRGRSCGSSTRTTRSASCSRASSSSWSPTRSPASTTAAS